MQYSKKSIADVYLAKIPNENGKGELFPTQRQEEVNTCTNAQVRRQKYYAWKLLEYALRRSFGYKIEDLDFTKTKCGKWTTPSCFFSISHSKNAVTVAVSGREIGVDIEKIEPTKEGFIQKVLTEAEHEKFAGIDQADAKKRTEYLIGKWTEKESIFKKSGDGSFRPSKISVAEHSVGTQKIAVGGEEYSLSVATENLVSARYVFDVDLTE